MPLQPRDDGCAVIGRAVGGQWGDLCAQPATVRATWRFESDTRPILLCAEHAAELEGHERMSGIVKFYDATVED